MTFAEFCQLIETSPDGVILLEGRREISGEDARRATAMAVILANRFPRLRFRSGGAAGADEAFAAGIAEVDAHRLQIVLPYATHRQQARFGAAQYDSPASLTPEQEERIAAKTIAASPRNKGVVLRRAEKGKLAAKAAYLIRDTMKVTGHSAAFPKPLFALFHVNLAEPASGGTGHTIKVCMQENVPFVFQDIWYKWMDLQEA